ncbi:hypothetical protein GcC1_131019, partial [Golovinomyces cichoracearum]
MKLDAKESAYGSDNDPYEQLFNEIDKEEEEPEVSDDGNSETDGEDL